MDFNVMGFLQSLIPMLPTLVIAYCVIKILTSGLNLMSKIISALIVFGGAWLVWTYIAPHLGVESLSFSLPSFPEAFNW